MTEFKHTYWGRQIESMALFNVEADAIEQPGPGNTKEILDQVRSAIVEIRQAASPMQSLPKELP